MAEDKKNPLGPTGERLRRNVERIREARGLSKKDLAGRVSDLGRPIPPLGMSRLEAGARRVDADDLTALALALNVSPLALLLPPEWSDEPVELTSEVSLQARSAWLWAEGRSPANDWATGAEGAELDDEAEAKLFQQREEYEALTHPPERRRAATHPANIAAETVSTMVGRLVRASEGRDREAAVRQMRITRNRIGRLQSELEELAELMGLDLEE